MRLETSRFARNQLNAPMPDTPPDSESSPATHEKDPVSCPLDAHAVAWRAELIWKRLVWFSVIFAMGWMCSLAYHCLYATLHDNKWPLNTFLYNPRDRYTDLLVTWVQSKVANPYVATRVAAPSAYFPFPYGLLRAFPSLTKPTLVSVYLVLNFGSVIAVWGWWLRAQRKHWAGDSRGPMVALVTFLIAVCNYPLLFAVDRGNLDPLAMCCLFGAIELAGRRRSVSSGLLLALASCSKGFPFAAALYWIRRCRLIGLTVAVAALVALVVFPAQSFQGGYFDTMAALQKNQEKFHRLYVIGTWSSHYSTDWLNASRLLASWGGVRLNMALIVPSYERAALVWAACLAILATCVLRDVWRELLAIVLIMLSFPNVANDYKLVFLMVPIYAWLSSSASGWRNTLFGLTAALLLVPKHVYFPFKLKDASISCILNPLLLLLISAVLWPTSEERGMFCDTTKVLKQRLFAFRIRSRGSNTVQQS